MHTVRVLCRCPVEFVGHRTPEYHGLLAGRFPSPTCSPIPWRLLRRQDTGTLALLLELPVSLSLWAFCSIRLADRWPFTKHVARTLCRAGVREMDGRRGSQWQSAINQFIGNEVLARPMSIHMALVPEEGRCLNKRLGLQSAEAQAKCPRLCTSDEAFGGANALGVQVGVCKRPPSLPCPHSLTGFHRALLREVSGPPQIGHPPFAGPAGEAHGVRGVSSPAVRKCDPEPRRSSVRLLEGLELLLHVSSKAGLPELHVAQPCPLSPGCLELRSLPGPSGPRLWTGLGCGPAVFPPIFVSRMLVARGGSHPLRRDLIGGQSPRQPRSDVVTLASPTAA